MFSPKIPFLIFLDSDLMVKLGFSNQINVIHLNIETDTIYSKFYKTKIFYNFLGPFPKNTFFYKHIILYIYIFFVVIIKFQQLKSKLMKCFIFPEIQCCLLSFSGFMIE